MARYVAFLRAINVGGRTVRMERLVEVFSGLGFTNVETFIASGNVIFDSPARNAATLERRIEAALLDALGYEVATFIRTGAELAAMLDDQPFDAAAIAAAKAHNIAMTRDRSDNASALTLKALETDIDALRWHGREIHWLCGVRQSESKFSNTVLERRLRIQATFRSVSTIRKIAEKYFSHPKMKSP